MPKTKLSLGRIGERIAGLILIAFFAFGFASTYLSNLQLKKNLNDAYSTNTELLEKNTLAKTEYKDLAAIYDDSRIEIDNLNSQLEALKKRPSEIKYVVRTETKILKENVYVTPELPKEYLFQNDEGLVFGRFASAEEYTFESFDIDLTAQLVMTERSNSLSLKGTSSYDNKEIELPVELTVIKQEQKEDQLLQPNLHLGLTASFPPGAYGTLGVSLLQYKDFRFLGLNANLSSNDVIGSFDPVMYNIGQPLPLVDDLYISAGVGAGIKYQPVGTITISTQL